MVDAKIKTLLAIVQTGSYTKAAAQLSLTQPAISHHVRLLEEEFSIKIFYRDQKKLHLTPEGEILLRYARRAVALSEHVRQDIEDCKQTVHSLSIGITPTAEENLVPSILAVYCNRHPDVHIHVHAANMQDVLSMLKAYELDLAIVEGSIHDSRFVTLLLDTDHLCLAISPQHPFAQRQSVSLSALKQENLILRLPHTGTRSLFEHELYNHGENLRNFHVIMELDNLSIIKDLVANNLGISIISYRACQQEILNHKLVMIPIDDLRMIREINIVYPLDFQHPEILDEIRLAYLEGNLHEKRFT